MQYRRDIDGLRAVAVVPVVLFHAGVAGFGGGYIGVDVFFVISGFLITSIIAREVNENRFSLLSFYERRARRILPALGAVILACLAAGAVVLLPDEFDSLGQSVLATVLFASNIHFNFALDYFAQASEFEPLLHTWSLAVEEQFYLFFPPLLMLLAAIGKSRHSFAVVAIVSLASLILSVALLDYRPQWVFYLIVFRAWELGAGALLALHLAAALRPAGGEVRKAAPPRWMTEALAVGAMLAILVPVTFYSAATAFPGLAAVPPVLGTVVLIWLGAGRAAGSGYGSLVNRFLANPVFVWIGLISYSLYLWHWPILAFLRVLQGSTKLPAGIAALAVVASFVLAWISYRFIERPFRQAPPAGFGRSAIFAASGGLLAVLAAGSIGLIATGGLPQRLPQDLNTIASAAQDRNPRRPACFSKTPAEGLCIIGENRPQTAKPDFLVWGDSHADMMMPGFDMVAKAAGQQGYIAAKSACPPVLDVSRAIRGENCSTFNNAVWTWLDSRPDIKLVVLVSRRPLLVEGTRYGDEAGEDVTLVWSGPDSARPAGEGNAVLFEAGLKGMVERLRAAGRRVVIIGAVPEAGRDIPRDTARRLWLGLPARTEITSAAHRQRTARTDAMFARLQTAYPDLRYIPVADLFCDPQRCRKQAQDGTPLYVDDDHITTQAAITLLPQRLQTIWSPAQR